MTVICLTHASGSELASPNIHRTFREPRKCLLSCHSPYLTVLVVDDERMSRHVACRMLKELGLRVLEADGAEEALDVFRISQQSIDLVSRKSRRGP